MILIDANILVYATNEADPQHKAAHEWLDNRFAAGYRVGLPWPTLLAFLRVMSNPAIFGVNATLAMPWSQIEHWLSNGNVWIPAPTERHQAILGQLLQTPGLTSRYVSDLHLATLAMEHGLTLCSTDTDFARFPGLKWENPLKPKA